MDFAVDSSCGYHLHIDVSDFSEEQLRAVAMAYHLTYDMWFAFVSESRRNNRYCGKNGWIANDLLNCESFADFARGQDRYQWFNIRSYCKHSTFEIRLHSGTLNGEKVCNWVVSHLRFVEAMAKLTVDEAQSLLESQSLAELFIRCCDFWPADIAAYLRERAAKFSTALPIFELAAV